MDQYPDLNNNQMVVRPFQQNEYAVDKSVDVGFLASSSSHNNNYTNTITSTNFGGNNWQIQPAYMNTSVQPGIGYSISESSSDGDLTPTRTFLNGN